MHPDVKLAMELQKVDREIARVSVEVAYLPRHIQEIESKLAGAQSRLEADRLALVENQKERKKLESGIGVIQDKISKYKGQIFDVKTNDQYKALQHEIGFGEDEIRKIEDKILERMETAEGLESKVKRAESQLALERAEVEKEKAEATARTRDDQQALAALEKQRDALRHQIAPATLANYDSLCRTRRGSAVAEVRDGACVECNVRLRPQAFQELKVNDAVKHCERCSRILYYVPPPVPEVPADQQAASNPSA